MQPQHSDEETNQQALRPTQVVTCVLMRTDLDGPHILIVQRSQRVGSYHGQWAGVSGFVEAGVTPEEQAYTEIREETSLQREQVHLLKRGEVVEHVDPALRRHFYIHPFLFEVLTPEAIHTDWEAKEMRWIAPAELVNYETVPKLLEVYTSAVQGEEGDRHGRACLAMPTHSASMLLTDSVTFFTPLVIYRYRTFRKETVWLAQQLQ